MNAVRSSLYFNNDSVRLHWMDLRSYDKICKYYNETNPFYIIFDLLYFNLKTIDFTSFQTDHNYVIIYKFFIYLFDLDSELIIDSFKELLLSVIDFIRNTKKKDDSLNNIEEFIASILINY